MTFLVEKIAKFFAFCYRYARKSEHVYFRHFLAFGMRDHVVFLVPVYLDLILGLADSYVPGNTW